jgi:hypothetical protein
MNYLNRENELLSKVIIQRNKIDITIALVWVLGLLLPALFNTLPIKLKVFLVASSNVAMAASVTRSYRSDNDVKAHRSIVNVQNDLRKGEMKNLYVREGMLQDLDHNRRMFAVIMQQERSLRLPLIQKYGLLEYVQALVEDNTVTVEAKALPSNLGAVPALSASTIDWTTNEISFPVEDIAKLYVEKSMDKKEARGVLIVAPSRTGKTSLLEMMIQYAHTLTNGMADFDVFAGKDGQSYAGIENDPNRYTYSGYQDNVSQAAERLKTINMELAYKEYTRVIIADELNNTMDAADDYDRANKNKTNCVTDIKKVSKSLITRGSSLGTLYIATSHVLRVKDLGFNTAMFDSVSGIILGRMLGNTPAYGSIAECLSGQGGNSLIDNTQLRDTLEAQFNLYQNSPNAIDRKEVLCLTNVGGNWRLCILPNYPDIADRLPPVYGNDPIVEKTKLPDPTGDIKRDFYVFTKWAQYKKQGDVTDNQILEMAEKYLQMSPNRETALLIREQYIGQDISKKNEDTD